MKAIKWFSYERFRERLGGCQPTGLSLRGFFHASTAVEPTRWFEREPEIIEEEGLGSTQAWCMMVDEVPVMVSAMWNAARQRWGFEVRLPDRRDGDLRSIEVIEALGLPRWTDPYFDCLPVERGFAVAPAGGLPIYVGAGRPDADRVVEFMCGASAGTYEVSVADDAAIGWLVCGPECGPYFAMTETFRDEASARRFAERETARTGAVFTCMRR